MSNLHVILLSTLLSLACSPPPPVVRIAPRSCDRPSSAWLGSGSVYSPNCAQLLLWAAPSAPCLAGEDDQSVFLANDPGDLCASTGAIFDVRVTDYRELWTDDGGCHCVAFGTGGPCAEIGGPSRLFALTKVLPVNCYPPGTLGIASTSLPAVLSEKQIRDLLQQR